MFKFDERINKNMSIENLKTRLNYVGGKSQQARMNLDKLKSLKKAMLYSYQAATAKLSDGREFRCLINRNKLSLDADDKVLSIPFNDICLTSNKEEETNIKEGDVIEWAENGSHWLVFLQRLEETAYFRADLRRCRYEIELGEGKKYWVAVKGPAEKNMAWKQAAGNYFNTLNYSMILYVVKNEDTLDFFHRFTIVKIDGNPWEVQAIDSLSTPGLIEVSLKEYFRNSIEEDSELAAEKSVNIDKIDTKEEIYIHGPAEVYPYDTKEYSIQNYNGKIGTWAIENESRKNMLTTKINEDNSIQISIVTGRSGKFNLVYYVDKQIVSLLEIEIKSL